MSVLAEKEIACPACKQPVVAEVWSSLNVHEDPELKDLLLGGEINIVECPACGESFYAEAFLLYHDPDNEIMAFVFPDDDGLPIETLTEKMNVDFDATQATLPEDERLSYPPTCFKGLNSLVEFIERDDEESLQGEVLEAIAKENHLPTRRLSPSVARRQGLPRVLPLIEEEGKSPGEAVLAGLRRLLSLNDRLTVYNEALARLSAQATERVEFS